MGGLICDACGEPSPPGKRFCGGCGGPLQVVCGACGAESQPGKRFCGDCGAPLGVAASGTADPPVADRVTERVAERRLTSVLFGDLVAFTTLSERRDAEDVRELLSRYFQLASTVVARYGGTIEKFIGDAVMAVWGVPVAKEDDAERAVRAGLELVDAVADLGRQLGIDDMAMRVGVLTGEVAVTLGAVNEGMVAGDAVNTAARIQAAAAPGEVWVDDTTRSLTAAAVSYRDAGEHVLKGKAAAVRLHVAEAVVASVGGAQRIDGLEATFTGRDRELRLVKELFNGVLDERRPRLIALSGPAGVGKTRLSWELEKYVDGLADAVLWHRARALSYGEGVTFWPFAEMVRYRLGILDGDPPDEALAKVDQGLADLVPDTSERLWLRPRLLALLDLAGGAGFARAELFGAWTAFLERVADRGVGVACVFDDMQHADPGLLDLIDHLVESSTVPLVVVTMARPELLERRPGWGTGRRATPLHLEPLAPEAMTAIVEDLVDGLPAEAEAELVARSEGIPLYALEMVRSLIDHDVVLPRGGRYVLAEGAGDALDAITSSAPPSLHALVAARLDALAPEERHLVQDAAVIGDLFSRDELLAVTTVEDVDATIEALCRKELVAVQLDRFSPERGQHRFVQALVRTVALETLSRRDRKSRHLAVARLLADRGDELAAVVARHLLDAVECAPADADVADLRTQAAGHLQRAAARAASLGVPEEAVRHYRLALANDPDAETAAALLEGLGRAQKSAGDLDEAIAAATSAADAYRALGLTVAAGRATAVAGSAHSLKGEMEAALGLMEPAYETVDALPDADSAVQPLAEELARVHFMTAPERAAPYADRALALAERANDWDAVVRLLSRQATIWTNKGLIAGGVALTRAAVEVGREHGCTTALVIPLSNLGVLLLSREPLRAVEVTQEALALARQVGSRDLERVVISTTSVASWAVGSWDDILEADRTMVEVTISGRLALRALAQQVQLERGRFDAIPTALEDVSVDDIAVRIAAMHVNLHAAVVAGGDVGAAAIALVAEAIAACGMEDDVCVLWPLCADAALEAGALEAVDELLAMVDAFGVGSFPPVLRLQVDRGRGMLAAARDDHDEAVRLVAPTASGFDLLGVRFYAAMSRLATARSLRATGAPEGEVVDLLTAAREGFVALGAVPRIAEIDALLTGADAV